jgi:hypothetical protein
MQRNNMARKKTYNSSDVPVQNIKFDAVEHGHYESKVYAPIIKGG